MTESESKIKELLELGYAPEDILVTPSGAVTIVEHKISSAITDKTSAADRLEKMISRKLELDYLATAHAVSGQELAPDVEAEYLKLKIEIAEALHKIQTINNQ